MLEERKGELLQALAREQEEKLQRVRGLIRQYGDHLEASSKLVESAIQSMEEPQMALYLQVGPPGRQEPRAVAGDPGSSPRRRIPTPRRGLARAGQRLLAPFPLQQAKELINK